ncbi:hypothetical protein Syun_028336 [Stephania yunnanensis]|uniref:Uncharacterized protein n=1 Tax=Stephania yunnanensis TaxID=152371 RepID=A0AAP0EJP8_9MAGN
MSSILFCISTLLSSTKTILHLHQLHARIIQNGHEQHNLFISRCTKLDAHPKHKTTHYTLSIFNLVFHPNAHLWNSILKANVSSLPITISFFNCFKLLKTTFDDYTFSSLIKCCPIHNGVWEGRLIHGLAVRNGVLGFIFMGTSLVDFYAKWGLGVCLGTSVHVPALDWNSNFVSDHCLYHQPFDGTDVEDLTVLATSKTPECGCHRIGVAESRQHQADSVVGCGIAVPRMSRIRDIDCTPDKTHLIPTKYCDSRSEPRLRAGDHSNQRHEYDSLGPQTLISESEFQERDMVQHQTKMQVQ